MDELQDNKTTQNHIASKTMDILTHSKTPIIKDRVDLLIENINNSKDKQIKANAIKAGYAKSTAHGNTTELKHRIQERITERVETNLIPNDKYFDIAKYIEQYDYIAMNKKDLSSSLKALSNVLVKAKVIETSANESPVVIPMLNIVVKEIKPTEPSTELPIYNQPAGIDIAQGTEQNPE